MDVNHEESSIYSVVDNSQYSVYRVYTSALMYNLRYILVADHQYDSLAIAVLGITGQPICIVTAVQLLQYTYTDWDWKLLMSFTPCSDIIIILYSCFSNTVPSMTI